MIAPTLLNNRYRVQKKLGTGGFGETFVAEDTQMPSSRRCVIKQLKLADRTPQVQKWVEDLFGREAAVLEALGDASNQIPQLYAYFCENDKFYLVQEYVEGQTLEAKVKQEGLLSENAVKQILVDILPVLEYVHKKHIIHRDIKPSNIILRSSDGKPVLIDFGAVKEMMGTMMSSAGNFNQTIAIGTAGFMPLEQQAGRPVYASDIFSIGITATYLLTGKLPNEMLDRRTGEVMWQQYAIGVSPSFATVIDKAIKPMAGDRYPTAKEMLQALQMPVTQVASASELAATEVNRTGMATQVSQTLPPIAQDAARTPEIIPNDKTSGGKNWQKAVPAIAGAVGVGVVGGFFMWWHSAQMLSISKQEARDLIERWQEAKQEIFAPPYNRQLAEELTTGKLSDEILTSSKPYSSINWLASHKASYKYGSQKIDAIEDLIVKGNEATIQAVIVEERTLVENGTSKITTLDTTRVRYDLVAEHQKWKIRDYKNVTVVKAVTPAWEMK
ncbi:MAG: Serine/threonine-protein kinase PknD [Chroococcidiopsis sp. SAG 2025]|uniref:protein kinase domain-containing protein n=1 Tax=Chroococcidiopsis sp. SAG 2025 TaxID=171389 RepID=UPI002937299A|nr:IMS domain-containing protein [Chroococcidiopsis sp. SAG 2025]MDV2998303.1 Serine/threonine-protein kinase PknD [Chroococcidiopsis sp. SAG 2025]